MELPRRILNETIFKILSDFIPHETLTIDDKKLIDSQKSKKFHPREKQ